MYSSADALSYSRSKEKFLLLRFANDLEEFGKVEQMPKLEGKKMFLYLAPKKVGVVKKSQQKVDREKREAEAKAVEQNQKNEQAENNGLFANTKNGEDVLSKLKKESSVE